MLKNLRNTKALVQLPETKGLASAVRARERWLAQQTPSLGSQQQKLQQWSERAARGKAAASTRLSW